MSTVVKKENKIISDLTFFKSDLASLNPKDRALIYTMLWCNSDKSNKDHYSFTDVLGMSEQVYKFIEHKK